MVQHAHVEGCRRTALFLVTAHVNVLMAGSPVSQPVNEPRVSMEGEDDRPVRCEQRIKFLVRKAVWMLARGLEFHQIYDVDDADLQVRSISANDIDGGQRLKCRNVTAARH